jgi:hypothetical protein
MISPKIKSPEIHRLLHNLSTGHATPCRREPVGKCAEQSRVSRRTHGIHRIAWGAPPMPLRTISTDRRAVLAQTGVVLRPGMFASAMRAERPGDRFGNEIETVLIRLDAGRKFLARDRAPNHQHAHAAPIPPADHRPPILPQPRTVRNTLASSRRAPVPCAASSYRFCSSCESRDRLDHRSRAGHSLSRDVERAAVCD